MRIAISGSHRTGKSTLVAALARRMPGAVTVDEPYHLMEDDGHAFAHPPSIEDFEAQLERSIREIGEAGNEVLFDRCPVDVLAYLSAHPGAASVDLDRWHPEVREAMASVDLVVFVPIEEPDRVAFDPSDDEGGMRSEVDERLRELLLDDVLDLGVEVVEVYGDVEARTRMVLDVIGGAQAGEEAR